MEYQPIKITSIPESTSIKSAEVKLAKKLLSTSGYKLSDYLKYRVATEMDEMELGKGAEGGESISQSGEDNVGKASLTMEQGCDIKALRYDPVFWNENPARLENNNCYNYATNCANDTFAQPGKKSGSLYTEFTCPNVSAAAFKDGLDVVCNKEVYKVALVMTPTTIHPDDQDYHWYRLVENGDFWGHKPGETEVTNLDNSRKIIQDPSKANRGIYSKFCQYMYVPKGTIVS